MTSQAPDLIEPRIGWRAWDVVELDGALRLCSLAFWTVWLPRRETAATCRRTHLEAPLAGLPWHEAPRESCSCGLHATRTAARTLDFSRGVPRKPDAVHRVVGQVSLWGRVVECEDGWRASHAYPARLHVPAVGTSRRLAPGARAAPRLPIETVACGLADYGVPVDVVEAATAGELGRRLRAGPARPAGYRR